ncbi:MAG: dihydrofolate reductase family protein [Melioribacteraceae bacterium]|nr:dihydrofolate reductase family protein [Melioribacteraceae bacterium]MCF8353687.1 dihydrofolate reductase family protein [Melioribacteraceae bacterium]MCF8394469.1 dihydrofolate reductase family protein [Melioribacteraceae bacterium]MCF8418603.1 dihydrofolate reductase family protein [Melioribacteraceae bacterium]
MQKLRVESFTISIDGFGSGPNQSLENPLGIGGTNLHQWFYPTEIFQKNVMGKNEGTTGIDNDFAKRGFNNIGAWILGRNMFAPSRGPWLDDNWKGWWGDNPPYHVPVFVLTNHARDPIKMEGGTVFNFVTEGIHTALEHAFDSAEGKDVRIGGGVNVIRQYLNEKLIDEMHLAVSPVLLGSGENLFANIDLISLGYKCTEHVTTENAAHIIIKK